MTKETPPVLPWVELALKLLGFLETILPAALVSYNAHLQSKVRAAEAALLIEQAQRRADAKALAVQESAKGLGRRALLDRALAKRPEGGSPESAPK